MKVNFNVLCGFLALLIITGCGGSKTSSESLGRNSSGLSSSYKYFVYVANYSDNTISSFYMNKDSGILSLIETTNAGPDGNPISLATSPNGEKLYVAKANSRNFQIFNINKTNGALTPFQTIQSNDNGQSSVSVSVNGRYIYLTSYSGVGNIFSVSSLTGNLTSLKDIGSVSQEAYLHPSGELAFLMSSSGITFWPVNRDTGDVLISSGAYTASITQPHSIVVGPDQTKMYSSFYNGYGLINSYNLDLTNKTASPLEMISIGGSAGGIAISNFGKILIATEPSANLLHSYLINSSTGKLTKIDSKPTENFPHQVSFFPDGQYALVLNKISKSISTYSIEESTGAIKLIKSIGTGTDPQNFTLVKIPN